MNYDSIKVSIILPIYNVGAFFNECMNSVLNQFHKNLEVLLIDDGSTDDSGKIADSYAIKDNRVKVVHQDNSGVSRARNVGISMATGKYICFSDPDDVLKPDYVSYMLALCEDNKAEVGVCAEVFTTFMPSQRKPNLQIVDGEEAAAQILYGKITVGCYSKMYNREFLKKNKLHFLKMFILVKDLILMFIHFVLL